jgi:hypothetical protein
LGKVESPLVLLAGTALAICLYFFFKCSGNPLIWFALFFEGLEQVQEQVKVWFVAHLCGLHGWIF